MVRSSMRSSQLLQPRPGLGEALRHVQAIEQHRVVAREEFAVVLERAQLEALDLGVGGVDVHHVDPAGRDRLVGEAVVEPDGVANGRP